MSERKKILYVVTNGVDIPQRTYASFILATTATTLNDRILDADAVLSF